MSQQEYKESELPAVELLQKLGYQYYNAGQDDERETITEVVLKDRLLAAIKRINPWLTDNNVKVVFREITSVPAASLMEANQKIQRMLGSRELTVKQVIDGREQYRGVAFIDFENIDNNDFLVVNQMKFKGQSRNSVPDIVVFVNGLPLAVIECKSPARKDALEEAISDLRFYQINSEKLFHYNQICAGVYRTGGRYAAIGAEKVHYQLYRADEPARLQEFLGREPIEQDVLLYHLFDKRRFLDIIRNFIIYEVTEGVTVKKLPRYQQIRAVNKTIARLQQEDKGGVVWHTQGSGKSITMVYIAAKLRREESGFDNPTIIVMTDRVDLDKQISDTFVRCGLPNVNQAQSIEHLRSLLKNDYGGIITTTIHKFQVTDDEGNPIRSIHPDEIGVLSEKENIYVMVDEAHRSQYGFLAALMRKSLPHAKFIAFTGTPIDREEKSTLGEFYGGKYLDVYTIKQSEQDGSTVPILYEAGLPQLYVEKELLDQQFEDEFKQEGDEKKELLRRRASRLEKYMTARERVRKIAEHVIEHYQTKVFPGGHKAMLVCFNRAAAIAYKKEFDELRAKGVRDFSSRIVMSFQPKKDPDEYYRLATPEDRRKEAIENFKRPFSLNLGQKPDRIYPLQVAEKADPRYNQPEDMDINELDRSGRVQYNNDAIMIVSDMLLTGYDVPVVQAMYLDKPLKEHNLLQAIARVNRTRTGKDFGLIVDYCGVTENLLSALSVYSGDLEPNDVMKNIQEEFPRLESRHQKLVHFFKNIRRDRRKARLAYIDEAVRYIEPEDLRDEFKELLKRFNLSIGIVLPDPFALKFEYDFHLYNEIKIRAGNIYIEDEGLRITAEENRKLQKLIDDHLKATGIEDLLTEPVSIMDKEKLAEEMEKSLSEKSKELKMRNRLKYMIKIGLEKNPDFYKPLAQRLEELIEMLKQNRITQLELFPEYLKIFEAIDNKDREAQRLGFHSEREFAVYKTLQALVENPEEITRQIFRELDGECNIVGWEEKSQIHKDMRRKIKSIIRDRVSAEDLQRLPNVLVDLIRRNE